jgi:hypothetical protein
MRVILVAAVLLALVPVLPTPSRADENQSDKFRDMVTETAAKLNNNDLSPEEKIDAVNRLREWLNRQATQRERGEARPSDRPERERDLDRQRQEQLFQRLEQARQEFDEAIRRLESLPPRQGFAGPPPGDRRDRESDRRGDQPSRRDIGPRDQRDARPMEPPRMPDRPLGNFPLMQPPRFAIGIAFRPKESDASEGIIVDRVMEQSPAEEAGLIKDDIVIAANGRELGDPQQLAEMVQRAGQEGREIRLKVRRDDETLDLSVRPRLSSEQDFPPGFGSISVWEMIPGQPPVLRNQMPPGAMPFAMDRPERAMEKLRRQMETMQRQIDLLREQVNRHSEKTEPRESPEAKPDPSAEDI